MCPGGRGSASWRCVMEGMSALIDVHELRGEGSHHTVLREVI
jgi:hypothetical protein